MEDNFSHGSQELVRVCRSFTKMKSGLNYREDRESEGLRNQDSIKIYQERIPP